MNKTEQFMIYAAYRSKTVDEYNFINHRLSWMIWSEAMILAVWGVMVSLDRVRLVPLILVHLTLLVLSVGGVVIALWTQRSVVAAKDEVDNLKSEYKMHYRQCYDDESIPKLTGSKRNHKHGHTVPDWLPIGMMAIQGILIFYALVLLKVDL